jgi:hypothetical protein
VYRDRRIQGLGTPHEFNHDTTHLDHFIGLGRHVPSHAHALLELNRDSIHSALSCETNRAVDDSLKFWCFVWVVEANSVMIRLDLCPTIFNM